MTYSDEDRAAKLEGVLSSKPTISDEDFANANSSISDADRAGISATTYLLLVAAWGPHRAFYVVIVAAILTAWFMACRRWPLLAVFSIGVLRGLLRR
jgi:hypothetical protein